MLVIATLAAYLISSSIQHEYKIIKTQFGAIRGKRIDSYGGQSGFVFAGVPIARAPVEELRFKAPFLPHPWPGILDTFQYKNACLSDPLKTYRKTNGGPVSEDCLYLNLFASRTCLDRGGCPVLAVIHGGGLKYQSPVSFRMDSTINNFANDERNIIVIYLPYRMSASGVFHLSTHQKTSADSNIILRDIHHGLTWIQREIKAFGGDPKKVTVMGHSGGAMLTKFAILSPSFSNLFSQAIAMSAPSPGADLSREVNIHFSRKISKLLNCSTEKDKFDDKRTVEKIISCMRSKPAEQLLAIQLDVQDNHIESSWGPWIDGDIIPDYTKKLQKKQRKINLLTGSLPYEFVNMRHALDANKHSILERVTEGCRHLAYLVNYEKPEKFVEACKEQYGNDSRTMYMEDDREVHYEVGHYADVVTRAGGKAYVYSYSYSGAENVYDKYTDRGNFHPDHTEDYIYIFGMHRNDQFMAQKDYVIERTYTGMLVNFIKSGDPSYNGYKWEVWDPMEKNYFNIDFDKNLRMPGMKKGFHKEAFEFYDEIIPRLAGDWTPLTLFPQYGDIVMLMDIFNGMVSYWANVSFDKLVPAQRESYWMWKKHVNMLEMKRLYKTA